MYEGRYSIEADDDIVIIHGSLTIAEAFDFLSYYDKQGFNEVGVGDENSTLFLRKTNFEHVEKMKKEEEHRLSEAQFERTTKEQAIIIKDLERHIKDQQSIIHDLECRYQRQMENHKKDFEQNQRFKTLLKLRNSGVFPEETNQPEHNDEIPTGRTQEAN